MSRPASTLLDADGPALSRRAFHRRVLVPTALAALAPLSAFPARAASSGYPSRAVNLVVPYAAGGAADILGRTVGNELGRRWSQSVVVDNRLGASGQIGAEFVGRAKGDPYTLLLATQAVFSVLPVLNGKKEFNLEGGFTPVSQLVRMPSLVLVPSTLKVDTAEQLIVLLKAGAAGQYTFSSNGTGTSQHFIAEDLFGRIGVKGVHVPYKGSTQALTALASGDQLTVTIDNVPASLPFIQSGKVKALAVTTAQRSPQLPAVPTLAESGVPGFDASTWMGLVAPPGIPDEVRNFISAEVALVLQAPEVRRVLVSQGFVPQSNSPDQFRQFVQAESDALRVLIARNNIRPE